VLNFAAVLLASLGSVTRGAPGAPGAPGGAQEERCAPCGGTGRVACPKHRSSDLALESDVLLCTFYAGCARCDGRGTLDCASCETEEDEPARARRVALAARFAEYDQALGRALLGAASAHFDLVCELAPMKAERKRRSAHQLLHLNLARLEAIRRGYLELFALEGAEIVARGEAFMWAEKEDHLTAAQAFCSYAPVDPAYRRGVEARFSIWVDPRKIPDDAALHGSLVHHAVHGLMNAQEPVGYTGKLKMGWADEGLSLWFEDRLLGAVAGFCFWPDDPPRRLRDGEWRPALLEVLAAEEPLDLERFLQLDTVEMTRAQHALGFALVDFLAARDLALLDTLLRRLRARTPARDAFHEVYGLSLDALEAAWRAWMAETYPGR
jgi:hypothetical protein